MNNVIDKELPLVYLNKIFNDFSKEINVLSHYYSDNFLEKIVKKEIKDCDLFNYFTNYTYINSGAYASIVGFCLKDSLTDCKNIIIKLILRIVKFNTEIYDDDIQIEGIHDPKLPENVEWVIINKLYDLYKLDIFPFMIVPVFSFMCNTKNIVENNNLTNLLKFIDQKSYKKLNIYSPNTYYRFTIMENQLYGNLKTFLKKKKNFVSEDYFYILFNVVFLLNILNKYIPEYRHNDLQIGNLLVKNMNGISELKVDDKSLIIKHNFILVINDFDFSEIRNQIKNYKVELELKNDHKSSQYYDFFNFLNSYYNFLKKIYKPEMQNVLEFIEKITPENGKILKRDYIDDNGKNLINYYQFRQNRTYMLDYFKRINFDEERYFPSNLMDVFNSFYKEINPKTKGVFLSFVNRK